MPHQSMFVFNGGQRSGKCHVGAMGFADAAGA